MKSQLPIVSLFVVLSFVQANHHVVRRQAPLAAQQSPPVALSMADDIPEAGPPAQGADTQARAAFPRPSQRFPLPPPIAHQPASAQPALAGEPVAPSVFTLPDGANLIVGQINGGFTCDDKIYGYYADTNNDCKIFHVCVPIPAEDGSSTEPSLLFSFFCNNGTMFNQEALVCDYADNVNCSLATTFYSVNEEFGKIPAENAEGRGPAPDSPAPGAQAPSASVGFVPSPIAPRANIPPPASPSVTAAAKTPAASGSAVTPSIGVSTSGASATMMAPETSASGSLSGLSASASAPGALPSTSLPGVSAAASVQAATISTGTATPPMD